MLAVLHFVFLVGFSVGCKLLLVYPSLPHFIGFVLDRSCLAFVLLILHILPDTVLYVPKDRLLGWARGHLKCGTDAWSQACSEGHCGPLLVCYTTVFGIYAKYNVSSKQVARALVGHRSPEWVAHQAANAFCLALNAQKPADFRLRNSICMPSPPAFYYAAATSTGRVDSGVYGGLLQEVIGFAPDKALAATRWDG